MFTDPRKEKSKKKGRKPMSQRQKDKLWRQDECDNCGKKDDGLISAYTYMGIELVGDSEDKICKRCIKKRKKACKEMLEDRVAELNQK